MAEVKFKVGDKVKCIEKGHSFGIENGEIYTIKLISKSKTLITVVNDDNVLMSYFAYRFEKVENNMIKNFREVIADIKEGEVWESKHKIISCNKFDINIKNKTGERSNFVFDNDVEYTLQRQQYSFEEAFKAYEEGKEIESLELIKRRYKKIDDIDKYYNDIVERWFVAYSNIDMQEIRGKWYINN